MFQIYASYLSLLVLVGLCGNFLVVLTAILNPRFHLMRYFLPASLALNDLFFLITVAAFRGVARWMEKWTFGMPWCLGGAYLARMCYLSTTFHLCAVSYDRFVCLNLV